MNMNAVVVVVLVVQADTRYMLRKRRSLPFTMETEIYSNLADKSSLMGCIGPFIRINFQLGFG